MANQLEGEFHAAMVDIYHAAAELGYRPTYFLRMVNEHGGLTVAKRLLNVPDVQEGLTKLWELGRLDISVEALILQDQWNSLFKDEEKRTAQERLESYGYHPSGGTP